ncbi:MAG: hypothetical protein U5N53_22965 [Mycobacterium sp.]|nr:hypothetical protein [Mycobacterium sp.]
MGTTGIPDHPARGFARTNGPAWVQSGVNVLGVAGGVYLACQAGDKPRLVPEWASTGAYDAASAYGGKPTSADYCRSGADSAIRADHHRPLPARAIMLTYFSSQEQAGQLLEFEHRRESGEPVRIMLAEGDSWFSIGQEQHRTC